MNLQRHTSVVMRAFQASLVLMISLTLVLPGQQASAQPLGAERLASVQFVEDVLGAGDLGVVATLVSPAAIIHSPDGEYLGVEGAGEFANALHASFSNLTFTVLGLTQEGDLTTVRWVMTGVHTGSYQGLPANCAGVTVQGIAVLQFSNSLIVEQWIAYDRLALTHQIEHFNAISPDTRPGCDA